MQVVFDIETDGLDPSRVWVIVTQEVGSKEQHVWLEPFTDFIGYAKGVDTWIAHNGLSFDVPVVNRLIADVIDPHSVYDTFVCSRLLQYPFYKTHSLKEMGASLKEYKGEFNDWSQLSDEMIEYCKQDVTVNMKIWERMKRDVLSDKWAVAVQTEHRFALVCEDMHNNGFKFNRALANNVLYDINNRLATLENTFMTSWPPALEEVNRLKYRLTADGTPYVTVSNAMDKYPRTKVEGGDLICYDFVEFAPSSPKRRIDKLWEAGWQPTEKTKGHYHHDLKKRMIVKASGKEAWDKRKAEYEVYGWTCGEENLDTLPPDAPEAASALAQWLSLNGRQKALEERLRECEDDGRIHTKFWPIGAWTHRMSHSSPNLANISSPFHGEPVTAVDRVKERYDAKMRRMFTVDQGAYLVGADAESIQLRVLAHYLRNDDYVAAIMSGDKAQGTDIHNVNRRALGLDYLTRDHAKTFIYAWLLGAGAAKVARILSCTLQQAKACVAAFIENTEGLGELKSGRIARDAMRGYFEGLDGRLVVNDSEYLMLAGYLQNGETVIMRHANLLWREWADAEKINYLQVNMVHDEWQTEVRDSEDAANRLGQLQCDALTKVGETLGCYCPMAGEYRVGTSWLDTH